MDNIAKSVIETYEAAIKSGQTIEIDWGLPAVTIENENIDSCYHFEGYEADRLITEASKSPLFEFCSVKQIILWQSQSW